MSLTSNPFAFRQRIGEWAERTFSNYFVNNEKSARLKIFRYGEYARGRRKRLRDATNRPDYLIMPSKNYSKFLENGIDVNELNLIEMSDDDPLMEKIVKKSLCAVEIKSSARFYDKNRLNFILDSARKERYDKWIANTNDIGALIVWILFDKVFITTIEKVINEGDFQPRAYEVRGFGARDKDTYNLPFEKASYFADVKGIEFGTTVRPILEKRKSGSILLTIEIDDCILENVQLEKLYELAESVK